MMTPYSTQHDWEGKFNRYGGPVFTCRGCGATYYGNTLQWFAACAGRKALTIEQKDERIREFIKETK